MPEEKLTPGLKQKYKRQVQNILSNEKAKRKLKTIRIILKGTEEAPTGQRWNNLKKNALYCNTSIY